LDVTLFPTTNRARCFTINIGTHEVAFSTAEAGVAKATHMIHMDRLIRDFAEVKSWICDHEGQLIDNNYVTALDRSTSVFFKGDFGQAHDFLNLKGVRRAIIAYWTEALLYLQERGRTSVHARHHNWNAVAALKDRLIRQGDPRLRCASSVLPT
jgi:hypothetical protein